MKQEVKVNYWLELILESEYFCNETLLDKCIEIKKMLIASINTAKETIK